MAKITIDLQSIIDELNRRRTVYARPRSYYYGDHQLAFATKKFTNAFGEMFREFALNLCPAVCDAVKDKLKITNFTVEAGSDDIAKAAWAIWQRNRMGVRLGQTHKEALVKGDAYIMVWPDETGKATFYPQRPENCLVEYDAETPGKTLYAAKQWTVSQGKESFRRLNVYYADRVEKYQTKKISKTATVTLQNEFTLIETVANPYGRVPVFHLANNADIGQTGQSELLNALPVQDALNKTVLDMMVAAEFAAFRQRWATGLELEYDENDQVKAPFESGVERLWITEGVDAKFGDFEAADLRQFLEVKDSFRIDMAAVTGTPLYYFMLTTANFPSGESLKKSETRFINKVADRQEAFGAAWEDAMSLALEIDGHGENIRLFAEWEDPDPVSEQEKLNNILLKKDIGINNRTALIEAGYGEKDVDKMLAEIAEEKENERRRYADSFNRGDDTEIDDAE